MRQVAMRSDQFERPDDFDIKKYLSGSFGIFKGDHDYEVVIDLDVWAADILRSRQWHPSQKVVELSGGEMRVVFKRDNLEEIEQWVLGWGTHATVVRPKALADRVTAVAAGVVQRYAEIKTARQAASQKELQLKTG